MCLLSLGDLRGGGPTVLSQRWSGSNFSCQPETEALASSSLSATIALEWTVKQYGPEQANVGDTLVFTWQGNHDVYELPAGETTCPTDFSAATLRGSATDSPLSILLSEAGTRTFACGVGGHCELGQIVTATVGNSDQPLERNSGARSHSAPAFGQMLAAALAMVGTMWASCIVNV